MAPGMGLQQDQLMPGAYNAAGHHDYLTCLLGVTWSSQHGQAHLCRCEAFVEKHLYQAYNVRGFSLRQRCDRYSHNGYGSKSTYPRVSICKASRILATQDFAVKVGCNICDFQRKDRVLTQQAVMQGVQLAEWLLQRHWSPTLQPIC